MKGNQFELNKAFKKSVDRMTTRPCLPEIFPAYLLLIVLSFTLQISQLANFTMDVRLTLLQSTD